MTNQRNAFPAAGLVIDKIALLIAGDWIRWLVSGVESCQGCQ